MGSHRGKPSVNQLDFAADEQGGTAALTSEGKGVTLWVARGHEAEDVIRDIVFLTDRLIHLVGQEERYEWHA